MKFRACAISLLTFEELPTALNEIRVRVLKYTTYGLTFVKTAVLSELGLVRASGSTREQFSC